MLLLSDGLPNPLIKALDERFPGTGKVSCELSMGFPDGEQYQALQLIRSTRALF